MPRKRREAPTATESTSKRSKASADREQAVFRWKQNEWTLWTRIDTLVHLMRNKYVSKQVVVKKVLKLDKDEDGERRIAHAEVRMLQRLPECNRVVKLLGYLHQCPDPAHGSAFFEYYPLGDVSAWKTKNFDNKNWKPVPEPYIWRFFIQMAQALGFIHNVLDPVPDPSRPCMLHRDIKPKNILVVQNGTTYPSFKLHDFGCATILTPEKGRIRTLCGTYEWQPPENPMVNTTAADVWALGACVHYLATGRSPVQSTTEFKRKELERGEQPSKGANCYDSIDRYYVARAPRVVTRINLTRAQQELAGIAPRITPTGQPVYNAEYSDELNDWMCKALHHNPRRRTTTATLVERMVPDGEEMLRTTSGIAGLADLHIMIGN
ncbi:serine/threonine protein kinase-like protein [Westerdykella ornata]|uniref:non-specific serine/threonine protein kinase n=1 Tax=Westerdykella ornata TaxID=318751 RepID=A0A6A6JPL7_WESOR|nr:serine/threonine protein kinase-like protein [Westerdykella ornata]KAF2278327.1 serine/threonine protein kinase-like protein [Westerdykella ornata]